MSEDNVAEPKNKAAKSARAAIFASEESKPKTAEVTFKGVKLELRQPTVTKFLASNTAKEGEKPDMARTTIKMVIENAYLPGTNDLVFEDSDLDALAEMPMSGEFFTLINKMNELLDIKVEANVKN